MHKQLAATAAAAARACDAVISIFGLQKKKK